jgi:hypothetical protein
MPPADTQSADRPASYADAVLGDVWRVAGLRLAPVTLGHVLLLERLGSPLLTGAALGPGDAAVAVDVLRRGWKQSAHRMARNRGRWMRRLLAWLFRDTGALVAAETTLRAALADALERPDTMAKTDEGRTLKQPWTLALHTRLVADLGLGLEEALGVPLRLATWLSVGLAERDGAVEWIDDHTRAVMDAMRRRAAQARAAAQANPETEGGDDA